MATFARILLLLLTFWLVTPLDCGANPTGDDPETPLAVHGTVPGAKEIIAKLYALYDQHAEFLLPLADMTSQDVSQVRGPQLAKVRAELWKARRDADHVMLMGEPAGDDLQRRFDMLNTVSKKVVNLFRGTAEARKIAGTNLRVLQRQHKALMKFLQQADAALDRKKYDAFASQMDKKGLDLFEKTALMYQKDAAPFLRPFGEIMDKGVPKVDAYRADRYMEIAKAAMAKQLLASGAFAAEAERVRGEIASSGTASLGKDQAGEPFSGGPADAIAYVANLWGVSSAGVTRAAALQWAFTNRAEHDLKATSDQLNESAFAAIEGIIDAAATTIRPEDVATVYGAIMDQVCMVGRRSDMDQIRQNCQAALDRLVARSPELLSQRDAYILGTEQPLRWRREFVDQQIELLKKNFPDAAELLARKGTPKETIRPEFARATIPTEIGPDRFYGPANWTAHEAGSRSVGEHVSASDWVRLSPSSRTAVVPFAKHHYLNAAVPISSEAALADLKTAVLVDDTYRPLSLAVADAISAAESQDYLAVGGVVEKIHLESAVTRFVGLPNAAYLLARLGSIPSLDRDIPARNQTCWRLDLKPMYVRNPYFLVVVE